MKPIRSLSRAILLALLIPAAAPVRAQGPQSSMDPAAGLPAGVAGDLGRALVAAINSPDTAAMALAVDSLLSPSSPQPREEIIDILRALRDQGGGVTVGTGRVSASRSLVVQLWARRVEAGVELVVTPDPADSTRLQRTWVQRALRRDGDLRPFPHERLDDAEMIRVLETELARLAAADQFSGVVLVARGGDTLFHRAYGAERPGTGAQMTTRSRFHLASMGKMFTAVAIARLVEQGRLSLDDTVGELLPEHPWTEPARAITVRQLMSHTSGLGGLFDRPGFPQDRIFRTATERLEFFAGEPLLFAPGERWSYSNEGYETLGAIVEKLTGHRFNDYLWSDVLLPAGMTSALPDAPADSLTDRAFPSPHAADDYLGIRPRVARSLGWNAGGAGGGHASAHDMFRFARALVEGRLVSRAMLDSLLAGEPAPRRKSVYAYGFRTREVNGRLVFGHGGSGPRGIGICNDMDVFADGSYTVVVMSNYDAPFCSMLKTEITEMLARN